MKYFTYDKPFPEPKCVAEAMINNISKAVYKAIYESHGLIEFDNKEYRNKINDIVNNYVFNLSLNHDTKIEEVYKVKFYKYELT